MKEQEFMDYIRNNFKDYEVEFNNDYIRVGHWDRGSDKLEKFLEKHGYTIDIIQDEDRLDMYVYNKC